MVTPSDASFCQVTLSDWSAGEVQNALVNRPLVLQIKRAGVHHDDQEKRVIVFVHGLNSSAATWLPFLAKAFQEPELQPFDFALFNYQTSMFSRLNPFQRLPRVEDWAGVLASAIQMTLVNQERYDSFVLVGHSMGGLVCKFAVRQLIETNMGAALRLHSLFTYGTPNHGSDRASAFGALLSPDLALLRAFSGSLADLQTFWNSRISAVPGTPRKLTVHERAIISEKDYWVAPASGINSLPAEFVLRLGSTHSALIRPAGSRDPRLAWFIDQLQAIQRQSESLLLQIMNGPGPEDFLDVEKNEEAGAARFLDKLLHAVFVLDAGYVDGLTAGDLFELYYDPTVVRGPDGQVADRIVGSTNLLAAIEVRERVSYCKLELFAYERAFACLTRAVDELARQGVEEFDGVQLEKLVLSLFGSRARKIPRRESDAARALENLYERMPENDSPARQHALRELLTASRAFVDEYPRSVMAERATFHVAWSTFCLGRYEEAEDLYERFRLKYPFSTSAEGARSRIEEIPYRIRLRDSDNAPDRQLELADYLINKQSTEPTEWDIEEGLRLAFEAYTRQPDLLHRIRFSIRFPLTARYVSQPLLGMDRPDDPQALFDWLGQYCADLDLKRRTRAEIEAKVAPERAKLLLQLLDATSADVKDKKEKAPVGH
jgi:pimeloyl-ACP methyl ester carboxylesterase